MKFNITRPLVIVKVHTTGTDARTDRVVGITINRFDLDGQHRSGTRFINPERDIPQDAIAIHGITNERVENEKTFAQIGKGLFDFINDADIAGFNVKFDIEMLMGEFDRLNLNYTVYNRDIIDLCELYIKFNPRNFASAISHYVEPKFQVTGPIGTEQYASLCEKLMDSMLAPLGDVGEYLTTLLKRQNYNVRSLDIRGLFVLGENNKPVFSTGMHKGKPVGDVLIADQSYYDWMRSTKANFPKDTLAMAERILKKAKQAVVEGV